MWRRGGEGGWLHPISWRPGTFLSSPEASLTWSFPGEAAVGTIDLPLRSAPPPPAPPATPPLSPSAPNLVRSITDFRTIDNNHGLLTVFAPGKQNY